MKPSSPATPTPASDRARARNAALINLLATPGLGSLMAGRRVAGGGQLLLALIGFGMMMGWFVRILSGYYGLMFDQHEQPETNFKLLLQGAGVFATAWVWALVTTIQLFRALPKNFPSSEPPRLG